MKTNTATLRIMMLEQPNKQGLYPTVIRAQWNGRAERRTGIAIPKSAWAEKTSTIKPTYPNAQQLNITIQRMYNEVMQRKVELEMHGNLESAKDLFVHHSVKKSTLDYRTLKDEIQIKRASSYGTSRTYEVAYNAICEFLGVKDFDITVLDADKCRAFGKYLQRKGLKNGTIFNYLSSIGSVWYYAIKEGLVLANLYTFDTFNYRVAYRTEITKKAISKEDFYNIEDILFDRVTLQHDDLSKFSDVKTDEFALAMYVLGYHFGGLAFVDMSNLRKDQLTVKNEHHETIYIFKDVYRQKTNQPVPIVLSGNNVVNKLIKWYLSQPGDYLFPINDHTGSPKEQHLRMNSVEKSINLHLRNVTGLDITYYSCRHGYATHYLNCEGSNPIHLATMMGRSVNGIFRYVKTIQTEDEILKERKRMGL